jgi:hypothetical protein
LNNKVTPRRAKFSESKFLYRRGTWKLCAPFVKNQPEIKE